MNTTIRAALTEAIEASYQWDIHHAYNMKHGETLDAKTNQDARYKREAAAARTIIEELLKDPRHQKYNAYPDPWSAIRRGVMRRHKQALQDAPTTIGHQAALFWGADKNA